MAAFLAGAFFTAFFTAAFLAGAFLAGAFLAGAFLAALSSRAPSLRPASRGFLGGRFLRRRRLFHGLLRRRLRAGPGLTAASSTGAGAGSATGGGNADCNFHFLLFFFLVLFVFVELRSQFRVLFVLVVVEVFHLVFVFGANFGLSNIKQASCSQGTITPRIPLFDGQAIAKTALRRENASRSNAWRRAPANHRRFSFSMRSDAEVFAAVAPGFCSAVRSARRACSAAARRSPDGRADGRRSAHDRGDQQAIAFHGFGRLQVVGGHDAAWSGAVALADGRRASRPSPHGACRQESRCSAGINCRAAISWLPVPLGTCSE